MATSAEQIRGYAGPALWSYGFRPFFLFGSIWAALVVAIWLPMLSGALALPTALDPAAWHSHELIYGYVPGIVAGFLLTSMPNWTGRLPIAGRPLIALFFLWGAGRLAISTSALIGMSTAAAIDLAFLLALAAVVAREVIAGKRIRNLKILTGVVFLLAGNLTFHAENFAAVTNGYGTSIGIAATLLLIMVIGGRIIPSFTRNWLVKQTPGRLPQPFEKFDILTIAAAIPVLILWIVAPDANFTAWLALGVAALHIWRLSRWAGERTFAEPLVAILHIAYAFIPLGFALLALAILRPDLITLAGALHAWTTGAIGNMTLAVMTRASLGHTGQPLKSTRLIQSIYLAAILSPLARITAAFDIAREPMLYVSALAWVYAFAGFAIVYGPLLARKRRQE